MLDQVPYQIIAAVYFILHKRFKKILSTVSHHSGPKVHEHIQDIIRQYDPVYTVTAYCA